MGKPWKVRAARRLSRASGSRWTSATPRNMPAEAVLPTERRLACVCAAVRQWPRVPSTARAAPAIAAAPARPRGRQAASQTLQQSCSALAASSCPHPLRCGVPRLCATNSSVLQSTERHKGSFDGSYSVLVTCTAVGHHAFPPGRECVWPFSITQQSCAAAETPRCWRCFRSGAGQCP